MRKSWKITKYRFGLQKVVKNCIWWHFQISDLKIVFFSFLNFSFRWKFFLGRKSWFSRTFRRILRGMQTFSMIVRWNFTVVFYSLKSKFISLPNWFWFYFYLKNTKHTEGILEGYQCRNAKSSNRKQYTWRNVTCRIFFVHLVQTL